MAHGSDLNSFKSDKPVCRWHTEQESHMNEQETLPPASAVSPRALDLQIDRWMGRRDAFGAIAGRCSAADAECLRQIRDQKLFLDRAPSWDEFCRLHLHAGRKKLDTQIRLLDEFGPT